MNTKSPCELQLMPQKHITDMTQTGRRAQVCDDLAVYYSQIYLCPFHELYIMTMHYGKVDTLWK